MRIRRDCLIFRRLAVTFVMPYLTRHSCQHRTLRGNDVQPPYGTGFKPLFVRHRNSLDWHLPTTLRSRPDANLFYRSKGGWPSLHHSLLNYDATLTFRGWLFHLFLPAFDHTECNTPTLFAAQTATQQSRHIAGIDMTRIPCRVSPNPIPLDLRTSIQFTRPHTRTLLLP